MLSSFVVVFLPRSKSLLISFHHLQWFWSPKKIISHCLNCFLSICHEVMGPDAMILVFWMLSYKPTFSLSSFTFIKRLFSSSLSAIRVVSSAYLRLLIFSPAILIPACASSSLAFRMMYSAYKLNKQGDNIQPWHTLISDFKPVCSMSSSNCCFLICIQISQEAGNIHIWFIQCSLISLFYLSKIFFARSTFYLVTFTSKPT